MSIRIITAYAATLPAEPPAQIELMPLGHITAADGREWWLRDAAAVVAASDVGRGLVIDYDHQTDTTRQTGGTAPAAGWITQLTVAGDRLLARVEWTEAGAAAIRSRAYRFVSPTFEVGADGTVLRILRAGLTNDPAITSLRALARNGDHDVTTDLETARARADAAEQIVCAARDALGLGAEAEADAEAVRAAIGRLRQTETALAGQVQELSGRIATIQAAQETAARQALIDDAVRAGKLAPALVEWARKQPIDQLTTFIAAAPVLVGAARGDPPPDKSGQHGLTAAQQELARACGVSEETFASHRRAVEETAR